MSDSCMRSIARSDRDLVYDLDLDTFRAVCESDKDYYAVAMGSTSERRCAASARPGEHVRIGRPMYAAYDLYHKTEINL